MGQKIGKAIIIDNAQHFSNLPKRAILNMWQIFNNIADGFGVRVDELEEICIDLKDELNISQVSIIEKIGVLFLCFDTDHNGLIDALEFFSCMAVLSGMKKRAIMEFILTIYDFDGTECLSLDEVVLALKSVSAGLCKLQVPQDTTRERVVVAKEEQIEQLVSEIFCSQHDAGEVDDSVRLNIKVLTQLLISHPDVNFWFNYFSSPCQIGMPTYELTERDKDFATENPVQIRSMLEEFAVNWDVRCEEPGGTAASVGSGGSAGTLNSQHSMGSIKFLAEPLIASSQHMSAENSTIDTKREEQWRSAVALLTPVEFAGANLTKSSPNCSIAPEWMYGYQSQKSKCNLYYSSKGEVVYNISKYAIIYSIKLHEQRIFSGHNEEILSLRLHPSKQIAATGEIGSLPKLLVWNIDTHKILYSSEGFHRKGITQLSFSPDGKILASVGNDQQQSIQVCLWEEGTVIFTSPVSTTPRLCLSCTILRDNTIVASGDSFLTFWSYYSEGYVRRVGNFSRFTAVQPITALAYVCDSDNLVSGTASGLLLLWVDVNCVRSVKGHNGTINSIFSCSHGILSGGVDQRIRMWSTNLEPSFTFDVSHYGINPCIRSLCMATDGTSILLGTKGSNIFEISAIDGSDLRGGPIAVGHSQDNLFSVATHPSKFEFITVGQDQTLRVFDMSTSTQLKIATFDGEARTVTYNPMGDIVVVGFGGAAGSAKTGAFVVLSEEDLSVVHEAKDSASAITVAAFSPEGETLAVGCVDGAIYLYAVHDEYELVGKCDRHETAILEVDFSKDGEWLRSNSAARELFFFNTDDASFQSNISSMRDIQWASNNCIFSWHVKETHCSPYVTDQLLCNNQLPIADELVGTVEPYLAGGTRQGYLRLYPFPCVMEGSECHRVSAHSSDVAGVKFAFDGSKLVSIGLKDRCIIQWKCLPFIPDTDVLVAEDTAADDYDLKLETLTGPLLLDSFMPIEAGQPIGLLNMPAAQDKGVPSVAEVSPGPENDTWLVSVVEPTALPSLKTAIPELSLLLEHVYGYECQTMRNNVRYVSNDEIVYIVSTMGVVLNTGNKAQRIFKFHSDAISSFASSKDGTFVATGQLGHRPTLAVWDSRTCITKFIAPELQLNSVCCVAFSTDNSYIAVVNLDREHTITVYDWKSNVIVSKFYGGGNHILGVFFTEPSLDAAAEVGLVSYGVKELKFWKGVTTRFATCVRPKIGEQGFMQTFLCGEILVGKPVIGTTDGFLYVFNETSLLKTVKGHTGPLTAMDVNSMKKWLVTGGKDGTVRVWSEDFSCIKEFVLDSILDTINPNVRSVAFNQLGTHIIIGTRAAEIFELSVTNGAKVGDRSLVEGHGVRQLWGLASHPTKEECLTTGDDATLRIWDCRNYVQKKVMKMDTASRAVTYSADGKLIAIGFGSGKRVKGKLAPKEGAFSILRAADMKLLHEGKDSNSAIRVVKFSPDGKTFLVASDDNNIYTYNVRDEYSRRSTIKCHQAPVLYVDFSSESNYIVSVDSSRTVYFTEVNSGVTIPTPEALRDEKWVTASSPYSWAVKGFWASQPPGVVPVTVQKSWGGLLVAAGSNAGSITVAHNPYPYKAGFLQCAGHAGRVSSLAWVAGDGALMSVGTKDHTLMQWRCLYDGTRESGDEGGRSCEESEIEIDGGHELTKTALRVSGIPAVPTGPSFSNDTAVVEHKTGAGEELLSNWYSMICAPSNIRDDDETLPNAKLSLEFCHGSRLGDCRKLLRYNEDGRTIFVVSTLAVIFDRNSVQQLFYSGHRDAIISLEVDSAGKVAATGELSEFPALHVWDAKTGCAIKIFERLHRQGISSLSFSSNNEYLISLGQDVHNSIAICHSPNRRWMDGHHICSTSVSSAKMLWCLYSSSNLSFPIVVGGTSGSVFFFRVVRGSAERVKGVYGKRHKIQPMLCAIDGVVTGSLINASPPPTITDESVTTLPSPGSMKASTAFLSTSIPAAAISTVTSMNVMLCGTVTGYIYIFSETRVINKVSAHEAPINALSVVGKRFLSAGKEGKVKLWSSDMKQLFVFNTTSYLPRPFTTSCHAVSGSRLGTSFIVGMRSGEVFEVCLQSHSYSLLAEGHSRSELHALDCNPANPDEYATAGDDGVVMVWSVGRRYCLRKIRVEAASRALAYSPDGKQITIGFGAGEGHPLASKDGAIMVLDGASLEIIREERRAKQTVTDIKYGPADAETMAVASTDGRIYIHDTRKYDLLRVVEMPTRGCAVTKVDFSADGSVLRACTNLDQLFYCNTQNGDLITNPTLLRDQSWLQHSCPFAWFAQGIHRKGIDGVEVSAVSVHPGAGLIAASYRNGEVRVYRYPCQSQQGKFLSIAGVASEATRLKFTADGRYLVLIDSKTRSVLQYTVMDG